MPYNERLKGVRLFSLQNRLHCESISVCEYLQQEQNFDNEFFSPAHKDTTKMEELENKAMQVQTSNTKQNFYNKKLFIETI